MKVSVGTTIFTFRVKIGGGTFILNPEVVFGVGLPSDRWHSASCNLIIFLRKEPVLFFCDRSDDIDSDPCVRQAYDTFKSKLSWTKGLLIELSHIRPKLAVKLLEDPSDLRNFLREAYPELAKNVNSLNPRVRPLVAEYVKWSDRSHPQFARATKIQNTLTEISPYVKPFAADYANLGSRLQEACDTVTSVFAVNINCGLESLENKRYWLPDVEPNATSNIQLTIPDLEDRSKFAWVDRVTNAFPAEMFFFVCKDNESYNKNGRLLEKIRQERANLMILDLEIFDRRFTLEDLALTHVARDVLRIVSARDHEAFPMEDGSITTAGGVIEFEYLDREVIVHYTAPADSALAGVVAGTLAERLQCRRYSLQELFENLKK